jgi:hypothetical protein
MCHRSLVEPGVTMRAGAVPVKYNIRSVLFEASHHPLSGALRRPSDSTLTPLISIIPVDSISIQDLVRYTSPLNGLDAAARDAEAEAIPALQALQTLIGHDLRTTYPITGGRGQKFYASAGGVDIGSGGQVLRGIFQYVSTDHRVLPEPKLTPPASFDPGRSGR